MIDDIVNIDCYWLFRNQMQFDNIVDIDNYWFFPYEATYVQ